MVNTGTFFITMAIAASFGLLLVSRRPLWPVIISYTTVHPARQQSTETGVLVACDVDLPEVTFPVYVKVPFAQWVRNKRHHTHPPTTNTGGQNT